MTVLEQNNLSNKNGVNYVRNTGKSYKRRRPYGKSEQRVLTSSVTVFHPTWLVYLFDH